MGFIGYYREAADSYLDRKNVPGRPAPARVKLSAGQHILHLLLTVFTAGLWAPVWIVRAVQGNEQPPPGG